VVNLAWYSWSDGKQIASQYAGINPSAIATEAQQQQQQPKH